MGDSYETSMSIPLDSDGFMRRQCPTCERELKWFAKEEKDDEAQPVPEGGYFCPYCAIQAPSDSWWTEAQVHVAHSILTEQFVKPELDKFKRQIEGINRGSSFLNLSVKTDTPEPADPLTELDDMKRVDFRCHPAAPVKVLDDWEGAVYCPVCGSSASA